MADRTQLEHSRFSFREGLGRRHRTPAPPEARCSRGILPRSRPTPPLPPFPSPSAHVADSLCGISADESLRCGVSFCSYRGSVPRLQRPASIGNGRRGARPPTAHRVIPGAAGRHACSLEGKDRRRRLLRSRDPSRPGATRNHMNSAGLRSNHPRSRLPCSTLPPPRILQASFGYPSVIPRSLKLKLFYRRYLVYFNRTITEG